MEKRETIVILDFGSQYSQLIARRIRECGVFSKIIPYSTPIETLREESPIGIILSGGPASVTADNAPKRDAEIFHLGIPVLGICYGLQLMTQVLGGKVTHSPAREYGKAELRLRSGGGDLFADINDDRMTVWMSHGDKVETIAPGFRVLADTSNCEFAAIADETRRLYGIQFHPEVVHTPKGKALLENFCRRICRAANQWTMSDYVNIAVREIREKVGDKGVILGLSGGVDSTVAAALINKAIGPQLNCIFVNNGLLRKDEARRVRENFANNFKINLTYVDAEERFLSKLAGVEEPEQKRKIIGHEFVDVFDQAASKIKNASFLAQGTTYPDVIESVSIGGNPSAMIKSHHNVGGLPEKMKMALLEPLRCLFKDEVRQLGKELGVRDELIYRQPFPGPGLAVRLIGAVNKKDLDTLREADAIVIEEMKKSDWYYKTWQAFAVLLPVKTVGVMGDERTYENVVALRVVESSDGMTADWVKLPYELMESISNRIVSEVRGVNRVVYDLTSKPPGTIEWE